jgi:hypothetical protein
MPCPSHSSRFDYPNNIWWWAQDIKFPVKIFRIASLIFTRVHMFSHRAAQLYLHYSLLWRDSAWYGSWNKR